MNTQQNNELTQLKSEISKLIANALTLSKQQNTKQQVCRSVSPICMLLRVSELNPASASVYFCLSGLWGASMCICVYVCVCQSTPPSRHSALPLPQYARSRIPAPLSLFLSSMQSVSPLSLPR